LGSSAAEVEADIDPVLSKPEISKALFKKESLYDFVTYPA